jgi:putative methyltransferase (TIGR04325 family)
MQRLKKVVKERILQTIELLPYGRDIVLYLTRKRRGISYRGAFATWEETVQAASKSQLSDYDIINASKASAPEREKQRLDTWFHDSDYPLLYWLSRTISERCTVLDLGGSLGHFFYSIQNKLDLPENLQYVIAELPAAVAYGTEIAQERKESRLSFLDSRMLSSVRNLDVFLSAGALQYMPKHLPEIIDEFSVRPAHVLIHNLPVHAEREFFTIQNLGLCEVPYRIYSESLLCNEMKSRGYELTAKWLKDRTIEIPFHRQLVIQGYAGYYFHKNDEGRTVSGSADI